MTHEYKRILSIDIQHIPDDDPDTSYLEQPHHRERLAKYKAGMFGYIGIRAKATIQVNDLLETIYSGGLWGIEDDSGQAHFQEIESDELTELSQALMQLDFTQDEIDKHMP